jgi:hypothetical protein
MAKKAASRRLTGSGPGKIGEAATVDVELTGTVGAESVQLQGSIAVPPAKTTITGSGPGKIGEAATVNIQLTGTAGDENVELHGTIAIPPGTLSGSGPGKIGEAATVNIQLTGTAGHEAVELHGNIAVPHGAPMILEIPEAGERGGPPIRDQSVDRGNTIAVPQRAKKNEAHWDGSGS